MASDDPQEGLEQLTREELIERILEFEAKQQRRRKRWSRLRSWAAQAFLGRGLSKSGEALWNAWKGWLGSEKKDPWPEEETRSFVFVAARHFIGVRWVRLLVFAFIPAVFVFIQLMILVQQNQILSGQSDRIDRQNNLSAIELTSSLRSFLFRAPSDKEGKTITDHYQNPEQISHWPAPNPSTIAQLVDFARTESEVVTSAIAALLRDDASSVSASALLALYQLKDSLDAQNAQLSKANLRDQDLSGADLGGANLNGADLRGTLLNGVNLSKAHLANANLTGAELHNAKLHDAYLRGAELIVAELNGADLQGVDLRGAKLIGADLQDIENWKLIRSIQGANLFNVANAPPGFMEWALLEGGVALKPN